MSIGNMNRGRLAVAAALVLAVIALSGCGSSSPATKTTATTTVENATSQPTTTTTTAPATNPAVDERIARDAELKLTDFPSGWEQKDNAKQSTDQAKCQGYDEALAAASSKAKSPSFEKGVFPATASNVAIYPDASSAMRAFGQFSSEATRRCLEDEIAKAAATSKEKGVEIGQVTSGQVSMTPVGDEHADSRLTVPFKALGLNIKLVADLVFVRVGRGIAYLAFLDIASPFDEALRNKLTTTVVDRLKTGLAQTS